MLTVARGELSRSLLSWAALGDRLLGSAARGLLADPIRGAAARQEPDCGRVYRQRDHQDERDDGVSDAAHIRSQTKWRIIRRGRR